MKKGENGKFDRKEFLLVNKIEAAMTMVEEGRKDGDAAKVERWQKILHELEDGAKRE